MSAGGAASAATVGEVDKLTLSVKVTNTVGG